MGKPRASGKDCTFSSCLSGRMVYRVSVVGTPSIGSRPRFRVRQAILLLCTSLTSRIHLDSCSHFYISVIQSTRQGTLISLILHPPYNSLGILPFRDSRIGEVLKDVRKASSTVHTLHFSTGIRDL